MRALAAAAAEQGVQVRPVEKGEELALAGLMEHAAYALQADEGYQRELAVWNLRRGSAHEESVGVSPLTLHGGSVPWAGLVRPDTAIPDFMILAGRLARETILIVVTAGDTKADHIRAGAAAERAWLATVDRDLVTAVMTQPCSCPRCDRA